MGVNMQEDNGRVRNYYVHVVDKTMKACFWVYSGDPLPNYGVGKLVKIDEKTYDLYRENMLNGLTEYFG
jgi:hypothetical protein